MKIYNANFTPDVDTMLGNDVWTDIGNLSITLPYEELNTNVVAYLTMGNFYFGSQVSNTYFFKLILNDVLIAEVKFTDDVAAIGKRANLPISFHGTGDYSRSNAVLKAQWKFGGSANGVLLKDTLCTLTAISGADN